MLKNRFLLIPIGAIAVALLSYGLTAVAGSSAPSEPTVATVEDPVSQPEVPVEGTAIGGATSTGTDDRIAFWQDRIKANPASDVQYQYLGELFNLKGRETGDIAQFGLATEAFQKAVELYPDNVSARTGLAVTLVTLHQWADAIDQGTLILQTDPRAISAIAVIGDASLEIGDVDTARAAFEALREKAGSPSVESRFARLAFLNGDTDQAIRILDEAAQAAVDLNRSLEEQAFYHYSAGEYRFSQGDVDGAQREFDAALARLPNYYLALAGRGRVAYARNDIAGAIESYRKAVAIIPKPELLGYLGDLYAVNGDLAAAEEQYKAVDFISKLNDLQSEVFNREISIFQATHKRDTAHAVRIAEAELETRKDIYGYDALAWALYNDGQAKQALAPARQAPSLGTRDARLLYHLGMIELALGLKADGEDHLREALALNPAFDPLGTPMARQALAP